MNIHYVFLQSNINTHYVLFSYQYSLCGYSLIWIFIVLHSDMNIHSDVNIHYVLHSNMNIRSVVTFLYKYS